MTDEENKLNDDEAAMECMYYELIRINNELFEINKLRLSKANNLVMFNSAIIAVLILAPIQILINSCNYKVVVMLLFVPTIFFGISTYFALKVYKLRNFITVDAKQLFDNYWDSTKIELLTTLSASLSDNINLNFDSYEKNKNFKNYKSSLNKSLDFFNYGLICLVISSIIVVSCYLWDLDSSLWNLFMIFLKLKSI